MLTKLYDCQIECEYPDIWVVLLNFTTVFGWSTFHKSHKHLIKIAAVVEAAQGGYFRNAFICIAEHICTLGSSISVQIDNR